MYSVLSESKTFFPVLFTSLVDVILMTSNKNWYLFQAAALLTPYNYTPLCKGAPRSKSEGNPTVQTFHIFWWFNMGQKNKISLSLA